MASTQKPTNRVFVIHGRNRALTESMFRFLTSLGLHPQEWSDLVAHHGKQPQKITTIIDIVNGQIPVAGAVVALFTPDDLAFLRDDLQQQEPVPDPAHERTLMGQPRQNVLFETGIALATVPDRTIIVQIGSVRRFSDVDGVPIIQLDGSEKSCQALAKQLAACGCSINLKKGVVPTLDQPFPYAAMTPPDMRRWRLRDAGSLHICTTRSQGLKTGLYERPVTGKGQILALGHVLTSLSRCYSNINRNDLLYFPEELPTVNLGGDLILIGSPKTNDKSTNFLGRLNALLQANAEKLMAQHVGLFGVHTPVHVISDDTKECVIALQRDREGTCEEFRGQIEDGKVTRDYGLVVRMPNPFAHHHQSTIFLFAGNHTYGTAAAAQWFTQLGKDHPAIADEDKQALIAVVRCGVRNQEPFGITLEKGMEFCFSVDQFDWS